MCKVISVLNMKGGVGKTTLSFNLAEELVARRNKVLLIDLDPQSSLTQFVLGEDTAIQLHREEERTIFDLFKENIEDPDDLVHHVKRNLDIIPSSLHLSKALIYAHDKVILGFNKFIKRIKKSEKYHYIIIDCPPFESVFNRATYHVSDFILNPVTVSKFSILGMYLLQDSMDEYCDLYNATIKGGTVINAFDANDSTMNYTSLVNSIIAGANDLNANNDNLEWSMFDAKILFSKSHKTSVLEGTALRYTSYCRFNVVDNFSSFVNELLSEL